MLKNMDADKIKLIIMNMEMLLRELKLEFKETLDNNFSETVINQEYISPPAMDYDEVFDE